MDHISSQNTPPHVGIAYFYGDYRDHSGSTQSNITASLLRQFAGQLTEMPTSLIDLYEKNRKDGSLPAANEMSSALRQICSNFRKSFVFIDAFDEIAPTERKNILPLLNSLRSCNTRIYITSRALNELLDMNTAKIQIVAHTEDIRAFLRQTLEQEYTFPEILDDALREEILNVISERAHGMLVTQVSL